MKGLNTHNSLESIMAGPVGDAIEQGKRVTLIVSASRAEEFAPLAERFAALNIDVTFTPFLEPNQMGFFIDGPVGVLS